MSGRVGNSRKHVLSCHGSYTCTHIHRFCVWLIQFINLQQEVYGAAIANCSCRPFAFLYEAHTLFFRIRVVTLSVVNLVADFRSIFIDKWNLSRMKHDHKV